jgi:hypothetical protein
MPPSDLKRELLLRVEQGDVSGGARVWLSLTFCRLGPVELNSEEADRVTESLQDLADVIARAAERQGVIAVLDL